MRFEMEPDEGDKPATHDDVDRLMDETAAEALYSYDEIMRRGSPELKRAAAIVLGAYAPGGRRIKEESA